MESFSCPRNSDIQEFIRTKACDFERRHICRTFLIMDLKDHTKVLAYYSITTKEVKVSEGVSKTQLKRLHADKNRIIKTTLIGQIGKNNGISSNPIDLKLILNHVFSQVKKVQDVVGTIAIVLECEDVVGLIDLYKQNGFKYLQKDNNDGLVTMYTKLKES